MIDLEALKRAADRQDAGDKAVVTRRWLAEVHRLLIEVPALPAAELSTFPGTAK